MTIQSTAPNGVVHPTEPAAPPPPWPSATLNVSDLANRRMIADLAEHARLTREHEEQVKAYLDLLQSGAWLTCTPAQDRAFDICQLEGKLRQIERELIGPDHGC